MKTSASRNIVLAVIMLLVGVVTGFISHDLQSQSSEKEVETIVKVDTIHVYHPAPADSVPLREVVAKLPVVKPPAVRANPICAEPPKTSEVVDTADVAICIETPCDSAVVQVPITQYVYEDSTYHLKVSGYMVTLDELRLYQTRETTVIKKPPKRWHLGVSAGYAVTPKGMQPYIGVGITYSVFSF